jgi:Domain of unknown function (DUF4326)
MARKQKRAEPLLSLPPNSGSVVAVPDPESPQEAETMAAWTSEEQERRQHVEAGGTAVANLKTDAQLIAWAKRTGRFVRICRGTGWGNPFVIGKDGDRKTVLASYRLYITRKQSLLARLEELRGKVLGCWCHPERCHGEELIRLMKANK